MLTAVFSGRLVSAAYYQFSLNGRGWPYLAYGFIEKLGGIEPASDYEYCCGTGDCYPCMAKGFNETKCGPPPTYCNKVRFLALTLSF